MSSQVLRKSVASLRKSSQVIASSSQVVFGAAEETVVYIYKSDGNNMIL